MIIPATSGVSERSCGMSPFSRRFSFGRREVLFDAVATAVEMNCFRDETLSGGRNGGKYCLFIFYYLNSLWIYLEFI